MKKIILAMIFSITSLSVFGMIEPIDNPEYLKKLKHKIELFFINKRIEKIHKINNQISEILNNTAEATMYLEYVGGNYKKQAQSILKYIHIFILDDFQKETGTIHHANIINKMMYNLEINFLSDGNALIELLDFIIKANNEILDLNRQITERKLGEEFEANEPTPYIKNQDELIQYLANQIADPKYLKKQQKIVGKFVRKERTEKIYEIQEIIEEILRNIVEAYRGLENLNDPFYIEGQSIKAFIEFHILDDFDREPGSRNHVDVLEKMHSEEEIDFFFDGNKLETLMELTIEANNKIIELNRSIEKYIETNGYPPENNHTNTQTDSVPTDKDPLYCTETMINKLGANPVGLVVVPLAFMTDIISAPFRGACSIQ